MREGVPQGSSKGPACCCGCRRGLCLVEDDVINEEEELEGQYAAIKIDYETEVIGEE